MAERKVTFIVGANIRNFQKNMRGVTRDFKKTAQDMQKVGASLTRNVTLPILGIAAAAGKSAVDFESAFTGVRKTVDATESEFASLRQGIINMSKEMTASAVEIAGVAEVAGQLGVETGSILEFTRTMVMMGDATDIAADQAATAMARIANVMNVPQDQFDEMGSTVVDLGNNFAATESEIVDMSTRMAAAGNIANMTTSDIFAIATALTSVGVRAESGGTAVQKGILAINDAVARGGEKLQAFADTAGMTTDQFATAWRDNAGDAFATFVNGLGRAGDNATVILDSVGLNSERVRTAFLSLANSGDLVNRTLDSGRNAWRENTALVEEASKRYGTATSNLAEMWDSIKAIGMSFEGVFTKVIKEGTDRVKEFAGRIENLSTESKMQVLQFTAALAALPPAIWATGKAMAFMGVAVSSLTNPLHLAVGALGTFWFILSGMNLNDRVKAFLFLEKAVLNAKGAFLELARAIQFGVKSTIEGLINAAPPSVLLSLFGIDVGGFSTELIGLQKGLDQLDEMLKNTEDRLDFNDTLQNELEFSGAGEIAKNALSNIKDTVISSLQGLIADTQLQGLLDEWNAMMEEGLSGFGGGGSSGGSGPAQGRRSSPIGGRSMPGRGGVPGLSFSTVDTEGLDRFNNKIKELGAGVVFAKQVADDFTASFGQGVSNLIVSSNDLLETWKNFKRLLLSSVIQKGITAILTGGLGGAGFFGAGGGLFGRLFGVNDALITKSGDIVNFHPDDSILAMKDFSKMPAMGGGSMQKVRIETPVILDGKEIYRSVKEYEYKLGR